MDIEQSRARRAEQQRVLRRRRRRAVAFLLGVLAAVVAIVVASLASGGSRSSSTPTTPPPSAAARGRARAGAGARSNGLPPATPPADARGTGRPGTAAVPILTYHVINPPPAGAPFPGLYVPAAEFADQMHALAHAGWHAVTLDQLEAYWRRGVPLPPGRPIVVTFDNGYHSQYANALPVLRALRWQGDLNMQLTGLPPSQGGLSTREIRALIRAGWEVDTQGISHADLITLDAAELHDQIAVARRTIQDRFGVPVNWFCYPSGHYDATVIDAVRAAGFVGATTTIPGWSRPTQDPYRLERVRVLGGTTGTELLSLLAATEGNGPPPSSYSGGSA